MGVSALGALYVRPTKTPRRQVLDVFLERVSS